MKAARWHAARDIRVEDVPEPKPGPGEVKVKVAWTGICGSDLHEYLAGPIFVPVGQDHPLSHDHAPITMGHEYCGTVTELGAGVTGLAIGDRVAIDVIDHGCGMTPGFVRDQLFRPFVSSKPAGFGIGAFEARQLVHSMGGALEVVSHEGEGTRFRILLPAVAVAVVSLEAAA